MNVVSSGGIFAHPAADASGRGWLHPANPDPPGANHTNTGSRSTPRSLRSAIDPDQPSAPSETPRSPRLRVSPDAPRLRVSGRGPARARGATELDRSRTPGISCGSPGRRHRKKERRPNALRVPGSVPFHRHHGRAGGGAVGRAGLGGGGGDHRAGARGEAGGGAAPARRTDPRDRAAGAGALRPALRFAGCGAADGAALAAPGRAAAPAAAGRVGAAHAGLHGLLRAAGRGSGDRVPRGPAGLGGAAMIDRSYDIVIIGSGAGGGTVAAALSDMVRDGVRILLVEQGARLADDEFTGREIEMADALYEDGGGFLTADGTMTLAFGRVYGGSTVVYTGTSLIAPERVIRAWAVPGLDHADIERRSRRYMEQNNVHYLDAREINENNRLFVEGCERAGYRAEQFPVNVKG